MRLLKNILRSSNKVLLYKLHNVPELVMLKCTVRTLVIVIWRPQLRTHVGTLAISNYHQNFQITISALRLHDFPGTSAILIL